MNRVKFREISWECVGWEILGSRKLAGRQIWMWILPLWYHLCQTQSHSENSENSPLWKSLKQTDLWKPLSLAYARCPINSGPISLWWFTPGCPLCALRELVVPFGASDLFPCTAPPPPPHKHRLPVFDMPWKFSRTRSSPQLSTEPLQYVAACLYLLPPRPHLLGAQTLPLCLVPSKLMPRLFLVTTHLLLSHQVLS